jgi:ribosomal protein L9
MMEVILLERIEKLGQMGDVVTVKPGYARNYLLPRKKALRASESSSAVFEQQRAQLEAENIKNRAEAERLASDMSKMTIIIVRQASESDQLYGSVTTRDISSSFLTAASHCGFDPTAKDYCFCLATRGLPRLIEISCLTCSCHRPDEALVTGSWSRLVTLDSRAELPNRGPAFRRKVFQFVFRKFRLSGREIP